MTDRIGFGAVMMVLAATVSMAQAPLLPPGLMGVVTGPDGKPLAGVNVAAQESHQLFMTSVFTDEKGQYVFPHLGSGDYKIWAQTKTYATGRGTITLDGTHTGSRDFSLGKLDNFEAQLDGSDWFESLPEDTADHRRMKQILFVACTGCHGVDVILNN